MRLNDFGKVSYCIDSSGNILYVESDRRIPIETCYDELQEFDEPSYVLEIANFVAQHSTSGKKLEVAAKEYYLDGLQPLVTDLFEIVKSKYDKSDEQLKEMNRAEFVECLYQLGMPTLYVFHKTAKSTKSYNDREDINLVNPFSVPVFNVLTEYTNVFKYLRKEDIMPYILCIPLLDAIESEDKWQGYQTKISTPLEFIPTHISFNKYSQDEFQQVLRRIRVYSADKNKGVYQAMNKLWVKYFNQM